MAWPYFHAFFSTQVLANIETAQRQNRLYDALKQGNTALAALQKARSCDPLCLPPCHACLNRLPLARPGSLAKQSCCR
jgi:hypothetical protein